MPVDIYQMQIARILLNVFRFEFSLFLIMPSVRKTGRSLNGLNTFTALGK